ncbi:MOB kinase activator-like 2 [Tetranychus urticae]|uniref:Mob1/phocein family protein n=1 Tax=Tetranychus urticae TaxID=32264 RepID=T1KQ32_TETUR|nr:MOB kinase activator-like 2 [Tetranychus urticae]
MDRLQLGEYFRDTLVDWFMGKGRRKEKDATSLPSQESKRYLQPELLECCTPEYRLRDIVQLPDGINYNEWLASHCLAFFDHINLIYGTISEFCNTSGCPDMIGPNNRLYLWVDEKGKRCKLPAPQYIDYVMTYTQRTVNDESIFPTKFDKEFPSSFESIVKKIMLLLFRVLAHIYHSHFKEIELLNLHPQTNCIFSHFMLFNDQFMMIDEKETEALADLAVALKLFPPKPNDNPKPDDPNQNPTISPSPKTSDDCSCSSRMPSTPIESGILGDDSTLIDDQQSSHDENISTQCRSISPFINNSNSFIENMAVDDDPPENCPMDAKFLITI